MANKVTIEVEALLVDQVSGKTKYVISGLDGIEKAAKDAQKGLDSLSKKKVHPVIDADNNKLLKKLRDADSKIARIAGKTATVTMKVLDKGTDIVNKLEGGLKRVAGKTWTTMVKIKDFATAPLRKLKDTLFSIKGLVMTITAGLAAKQFVINPINLADQYSSAQIGFSTLLGESGGQQMMNQIDEFAKATPFKTSGVISNVQKMMAYGWDVDRVIDDMETIGDAAAATGKGDEGLESIVYALSEIRSKGKLSTQELNQLAGAGIKAKQYLAQGLGYGTDDAGLAKLAKDLEGGAIGANKAIDLILEGMKEFDGMMDRTANETVEGLKSQIEDAFEINIFRRWGQGLQDGAKRGFGSVVQLLDEADGALEKFGDTIYEIGSNISNWLADKFENAIGRVLEITDSFEFKNASLGEKVSMLWNGVIVDPLKEWWEGGGQQKTAETAGKIGAWMGKTLTKGLLAIFGATDVLDDGIGSDAGANVAGSFLDGFLDNFDGSAITQAFVDAISNVWGALPTWAKFLIGGYGSAKVMSGISSLAGGVASFAGGVKNTVGGFNVASSAFPILTSSGSGILGGIGKAGVALGASTTGGALLAGTAGIAGGVAGAASAGKGIYDLYGSYKAYKSGDKTEAKAKGASGGSALGGVAAGAGVGALIGGPLGALIGAGVGGVAGWIGGEKWADNIRDSEAAIKDVTAATRDLETEGEKLATKNKMIWENMKSHFGDIKLSMSEIERIADQIVWGDDMGNFETFSSAVKNAEANLQSLKSAAADTEKWMWKASLGVKFNEDEQESIKTSFDDYINAAKSFVENKHYEFTAAVSLLVDVESKEGKSIIDSGNSFYGKMQEDLAKAGEDLGDKLTKALKDGIISADEQEAITAAQQKIASITEKIANAEQKAELELIKIKFGSGNLDLDSFDNFMSQMQTTIDERMTANDEAFTASVASLNLQLEEDAITEEEYNKQLQALVSGYTATIDKLKAEIKDVELQIIGESYADDLGVTAEEAAKKLERALNESLKTGVDPIEWTDAELCKLLGVDNLPESTAGAIKQMLSGVFGQIESLDVNIEVNPKVGEDAGEKVKEEVDKTLPETVESTVGVNISGEKHIQNTIDILVEDFGVPEDQAATIALLLTGDKEILNKIDISKLAKEFGIPEEKAEEIVMRLTGEKSVENRISVLAGDFGIKDSISKTITINLKGKIKKVGSAISKFFGGGDKDGDAYRGGIFGGSSALESFARGGLVRGGSKLIEVAEEGTPEMIIPLSSQRRDRALKLWEKAGEMLNVPGFARGGLTNGRQDEGIRFHRYGSDDARGGQTVQIDVGGITFEIHVNGTDAQSIAQAIKEQVADIAEDVAGIMADAFAAQFENTPVRGGAA